MEGIHQYVYVTGCAGFCLGSESYGALEFNGWLYMDSISLGTARARRHRPGPETSACDDTLALSPQMQSRSSGVRRLLISVVEKAGRRAVALQTGSGTWGHSGFNTVSTGHAEPGGASVQESYAILLSIPSVPHALEPALKTLHHNPQTSLTSQRPIVRR